MFKFGSRDEIVSESSYAQKEYDANSPLWSEVEPAKPAAQEQKNGASAKLLQECDSDAKAQELINASVGNSFAPATSILPQPELAEVTGSSKSSDAVKIRPATYAGKGERKASVAGRDDAKDIEVQPKSVKEESDQQGEDASTKEQSFRLVSASAMLPRSDKTATGGEDAFFITDNNWIGVSDGVGGWADSGIDAGLYSRELMARCEDLALQSKDNGKPEEILTVAHSRTHNMGSATAVVAMLRGKTLEVSNVGDSGFLMIRQGKAVTRSTPMQYAFNYPHQLGRGNFEKSDNYVVPVERGDVIVLGTDGLFDNLFENQIVDVVEVFKEGRGAGPKVVANFLATLAQQVSKSSTGSSPFAVAAYAVDISFSGGKEDDITVIVSYVT
eukprot:TRINITY_DN776_c0_g1_i5.p1 TRINITY_DN776_c0_g1~~TRINITY_DN776_c0_g1_i5.p1  ORF type:complete len:386 (+),score=52.01 TRINITY_DN776_c0_g1_i5:93-1250(+)